MFTRPSRERSLLAPTSSGTTRYSTTSAMTNRTMPRRNGLTKKGSQGRQPRHQLRQVLLASASAPGFRSAFAGSVRISSPLPGLRARTPPHVQQPAQGYPAQERTSMIPPKGAVVTATAQTARSMWTLFEPIHAVTYFAPEARSAFEQTGLRGFWRGYFAGRAAPLGPAGAAVVTASVFNLAPAFVARAVPGIWDLITPEEALRTRLAGAAEALRGLLTDRESETAAAADLLWQVAGELDCSGRVLAAANAALPVLEDGSAGLSGPARLWQAATLLREHRGDGHFAALTAADIDGCEAVALRCCVDLQRENLQPVRGWTDEEWEA